MIPFRNLLAGALVVWAGARAQDAHDIVRQADLQMRGKTSTTEVSIEVIRPTWTRTLGIKTWSRGQDLALVLITAPAHDQGTAFLKRGREVWNWVPALERTIKLPPSMMSQSWMGTDMTNDDFVKEASMVDDYVQTMAGRDTLLGRPCWVIDLQPKPGAPVVWGKVRLWIGVKNYLELKTEFYDEDGALVNTLIGSEIKTLGGRLMPTRLEMIPADKPGQKTVFTYRSAVFNQPIPDDTFTLRHLTGLR